MPLSRHFYELDEVCAALSYSTTRYDTKECLFWCNELLQSGCAAEAIQTLFEAWLWQKGPFCLQWILHAWKTLSTEEVKEEDIRCSAYQLSTMASVQDHSLWSLLVLGRRPPSDPLTYKTPSPLPSSLHDSALYFLRALYQGKAHHAWWMAQQLEETELDSLLEWYRIHFLPEKDRESYQTLFSLSRHYSALLGYSSSEYDRILRCLCVLSCCLSENQRIASFKPLPVSLPPSSMEFLESLSAQIGRKSARLFSIPVVCLYGTTRRGQMKWTESTLSHLYDIEPQLMGCPFWEEALSEYADISDHVIEWKSEDAKECFYRTYFPDDIPDEWIREDQKKSHGDGILGPRDVPSILHYTKKYLSKHARLAWNKASSVSSFLESLSLPFLHPREFAPQEPLCTALSDSLRLPQHRRFRY